MPGLYSISYKLQIVPLFYVPFPPFSDRTVIVILVFLIDKRIRAFTFVIYIVLIVVLDRCEFLIKQMLMLGLDSIVWSTHTVT